MRNWESAAASEDLLLPIRKITLLFVAKAQGRKPHTHSALPLYCGQRTSCTQVEIGLLLAAFVMASYSLWANLEVQGFMKGQSRRKCLALPWVFPDLNFALGVVRILPSKLQELIAHVCVKRAAGSMNALAETRRSQASTPSQKSPDRKSSLWLQTSGRDHLFIAMALQLPCKLHIFQDSLTQRLWCKECSRSHCAMKERLWKQGKKEIKPQLLISGYFFCWKDHSQVIVDGRGAEKKLSNTGTSNTGKRLAGWCTRVYISTKPPMKYRFLQTIPYFAFLSFACASILPAKLACWRAPDFHLPKNHQSRLRLQFMMGAKNDFSATEGEVKFCIGVAETPHPQALRLAWTILAQVFGNSVSHMHADQSIDRYRVLSSGFSWSRGFNFLYCNACVKCKRRLGPHDRGLSAWHHFKHELADIVRKQLCWSALQQLKLVGRKCHYRGCAAGRTLLCVPTTKKQRSFDKATSVFLLPLAHQVDDWASGNTCAGFEVEADASSCSLTSYPQLQGASGDAASGGVAITGCRYFFWYSLQLPAQRRIGILLQSGSAWKRTKTGQK